MEKTDTTYVRNAWYAAGWPEEITATPLARSILNEPVVLFRGESGKPAALEDCCPHRMAPLSLGEVEGDNLRCGYHGLLFDCAGKCLEVPGQVKIPPRAKARAYPVVEKWNIVWIWMGDPAAADEAAIPHCPWLDSPDWAYSHGTTHYESNYVLLIDNLMDLSHTTFAHKGTIGTDSSAQTPVTATREEDTVLVERLMMDGAPSKFYKAVGGFDGNVDRWHRIRFHPPAAIIIDAGAVPAGTNDPSRGIDTRIISYLTPETHESVFQFWAFARDFALDDTEMTGFIKSQIEVTFNEDKVILDGQQRNVSARPGQRLLDNNADSGVVLSRKLLQEHLDAEAPQTGQRA